MQLTFNGRQAFILGGTCDLGLCLAEEMIKTGITPTLTFRSRKGLERIDRRLNHRAGQYRKIHYDLSSSKTNDELSTALAESGRHPDFMVDLAQGNLESLVASVDESALDLYFQANITGRAKLLKSMAREMLKQRKGRLVFVSSTAAGKPNPGQGFYAASKLAAEALYRNLGLELGSRGITTVSLQPGYIQAGRGNDFLEELPVHQQPSIPIKRPLNVMEVVQTILFLLSDAAFGINATTLCMDGGLTAGK